MGMNIFRFAGDMSHLAGTLWLLKMARRGHTSGISVKAQELYLIVFLTRYLDLFTTFYSLYNSMMKVTYILCTASIIFIIRYSDSPSSSSSSTTTTTNIEDSFQHWLYLLLPSIFIALIIRVVSGDYFDDWTEYLWTFSIVLESVAMVPQLVMFKSSRSIKGNRNKDAKEEILYPIFLLGIYRALYIGNWIYRAHTERHYRHHYLVYICGIIQVFLYSQFFHVCCKETGICPDGSSDDDDDEEGEEDHLTESGTDVESDALLSDHDHNNDEKNRTVEVDDGAGSNDKEVHDDDRSNTRSMTDKDETVDEAATHKQQVEI